jgi:hypothetical protein
VSTRTKARLDAFTALMLASENGQPEVVRLLREAGHAWEGTYIYAPYLVSAFVDEGLALRLRELHLGGNLSPKSEAVLNAGH